MIWLLACVARPGLSDAQLAAAGAAAAEVEVDRLMPHVEALVSGRAHEDPYYPPESRYAGMPFTHVSSAEYVYHALAAAGLEPAVEPAGSVERPSYSVWADAPGETRPDELVLLTAHHDAWFFGADDNASGVAVILEAARVLADQRPDRTIRIISWDREEEGLVGAAAWVEAHPEVTVHRVVNLDSVGYTDSAPGSQRSILGLDAPDTGDFLAVIAPEWGAGELEAALGFARGMDEPLKTAGVLAPSDSHYALTTDLLRSDHAPFWGQGVGGLFLTDTTEFRNPRYHTAEDTVDTLDEAFLGRVARFTAGMTAAYAEE